jgi:hypothetical protein
MVARDGVEPPTPAFCRSGGTIFRAGSGPGLVNHLRNLISSVVRITITPEWVGLLDFQTRFPSALAG